MIDCSHLQNTFSQSICMIFGILQRSFVLNTRLNSISIKFITKVALPSEKVNNSIFRLRIQERLLHSRSHRIRILQLHQLHNSGTLQFCVVLNMSVVFTFTNCLHKMAPPGERQQFLVP